MEAARLEIAHRKGSHRQSAKPGDLARASRCICWYLVKGPAWWEIRDGVPISGRGDEERQHSLDGVVVPDRLLIVTSCPFNSSYVLRRYVSALLLLAFAAYELTQPWRQSNRRYSFIIPYPAYIDPAYVDVPTPMAQDVHRRASALMFSSYDVEHKPNPGTGRDVPRKGKHLGHRFRHHPDF